MLGPQHVSVATPFGMDWSRHAAHDMVTRVKRTEQLKYKIQNCVYKKARAAWQGRRMAGRDRRCNRWNVDDFRRHDQRSSVDGKCRRGAMPSPRESDQIPHVSESGHVSAVYGSACPGPSASLFQTGRPISITSCPGLTVASQCHGPVIERKPQRVALRPDHWWKHPPLTRRRRPIDLQQEATRGLESTQR